MDVLLPPWLKISRLQTSYLDNTGMTRALYTAAPETTGFGGDRLKLSLEFAPTSSKQTPVERAAIRSFLARLRGRQNRAYLWDPSYRKRGSFPAFELLSNNTFANGTTGWISSSATLSVADRVMRVTRTGSAPAELLQPSVGGLTQYAPHALRSFIVDGRGSSGLLIGRAMSAGVGVGSELTDYSTARGLGTVSLVARGTSADEQYPAVIADTGQAGDYIELPWCSLSRCALVDNGRNSLLRSDELDNVAWSKPGATIVANVATAPDGTLTGDAIKEASSTGGHGVSQAYAVSSAAADFVLGVSLKAAERTWALLVLREDTGLTEISVYINLATGAIGTTATGANWSNLRTPVAVDRGNGWYDCYILGRKTNAATQLTAFVQLATGDVGGSYAGDNTSRILARRVTSAPSSSFSRLTQTTTVATSGSAQTGSAFHLKGLPASMNGLLLPDDRFEIITSRGSEMKIVTASLDSDAAGLGYVQFEPPLLGVPADNAPIIIHEPMTRAIFVGDVVGFSDEPGILTTASADFEESA